MEKLKQELDNLNESIQNLEKQIQNAEIEVEANIKPLKIEIAQVKQDKTKYA